MQDKNKLRINYNNKVYNVNVIDFNCSRGEIETENKMETLMCRINLDNLIHCIGIKDRNNKLIYEGDIIKEKWYSRDDERYRECLYSVEYDKEKMAYCFVEVENGFKNFFVDMEYIQDDYEVIGNIYENKELLGGANANI